MLSRLVSLFWQCCARDKADPSLLNRVSFQVAHSEPCNRRPPRSLVFESLNSTI